MSYLDAPRNRVWYKVLLAACSFRNGVPGNSDAGWGREKGGKTSTRIFYQVIPPTMLDKGGRTSSHWNLVGSLIEFTSELCTYETKEKQMFSHWLLLCTGQEWLCGHKQPCFSGLWREEFPKEQERKIHSTRHVSAGLILVTQQRWSWLCTPQGPRESGSSA